MEEYYVYALLDPRFKDNYSYICDDNTIIFEYKPYYIGKGKRYRMNQHYGKKSLEKNTHKNNVIHQIISSNNKPISIKIFENLTEQEAYELEIKIIRIIGLENLTNKDEGGVGRSSSTMLGDKNPMYGKHPTPWNKGVKSLVNSPLKGKSLIDIVGAGEAAKIKTKLSKSRKGKSWEEYFGIEKAQRVRKLISEQRKGYKHSKETINKMRKSSTPEIILNRKTSTLKKRKKQFDADMEKIKPQLIKFIENGFTDSEIIKRIEGISRYRLKKMIYLLRNDLNSDIYFKINIK